MKEKIEKQAFCNTDEARTFIRARLANRKGIARKEVGIHQDALDNVLRDEALEAMSDDKLTLEIFFSEEIPDVRIAKEVCLQCSVIEDCLRDAIERETGYGVWGGQFFKAGAIDQPKRRGRPPKVVRPEFEVLEIPISREIEVFIKEREQDHQAA